MEEKTNASATDETEEMSPPVDETEEISSPVDEIQDEEIGNLINEYENEINENRAETKKAVMLAAIGAIIIIGIAAVIISLQKTPNEVIHNAVEKTFTEDAITSRTKFIKKTFAENKSEINVSLSLDNISLSGVAALFDDGSLSSFISDLQTTKPTLNVNTKTDINNENALIKITLNVENNISDNPFADSIKLTGEEGKTCADFSLYSKDNALGIIDSDGECAIINADYSGADFEMLKNTLNETEEIENSKLFNDITYAVIDNSVIRNPLQGYGITINNKQIGANRYILTMPEEVKPAIKDAIEKVCKDNNYESLIEHLNEFIDEYDDNTCEINLYEKNGMLIGISIICKDTPESDPYAAENTDSAEQDLEEVLSCEIIFTGSSSPLDSMNVNINSSVLSISYTDEIDDNKYSIKINDLLVNYYNMLNISFSGNVDISSTDEDFISVVKDAEVDSEKADEIFNSTFENIGKTIVPSQM